MNNCLKFLRNIWQYWRHITCSAVRFLQMVRNSWKMDQLGMKKICEYLSGSHLLSDQAVAILIHVFKQLFYLGLFAHELFKWQATIKVSIHGRKKIFHFLPETGLSTDLFRSGWTGTGKIPSQIKKSIQHSRNHYHIMFFVMTLLLTCFQICLLICLKTSIRDFLITCIKTWL